METTNDNASRDVITLIRAHYDGDEARFREESERLAADFDRDGRHDLASFIRAQTGAEPSWVPMQMQKPARNCDRFQTAEEATRAFQQMRGHAAWADACLWDSRDEIGTFIDWLFAPAEGGAE